MRSKTNKTIIQIQKRFNLKKVSIKFLSSTRLANKKLYKTFKYFTKYITLQNVFFYIFFFNFFKITVKYWLVL